MDATGQLLVDLQDLPDLAVLPVGGLRAGVFELEAVLVDPLVRGLQGGHQLLRPDDEDDIGRAPGEEASWLPEAEAMTRVPSGVTACTLPRA